MDSSKEKIEAKLCEYVEGELDEADRADIERHLQTNPQHKSLVAELRRHRELLQTLPRATVPGELNENLTGQLERSALLSDDDETAEAGVRINRWPQFTAVAAVILLAVGLGVVVYYVLPPAGGGHGNVAMTASSPDPTSRTSGAAPTDPDRYAYGATPASAPAVRRLDAEALSDLDARGVKPSTNTPAPAAAPTPGLAPAAVSRVAESRAAAPASPLATASDLTAARLRDLTAGPGLVTSGEVEELQKRMRSTLGGEANAAFNLEPRSSVYLIVQTPDAAATTGQVAAYFKTNNIQYMNYEGPPIDLGASTDALAKLSTADTDTDLAKGGALGGGLSSPSQVGGRGAVADRAAGGSYGGFGGGSGGGARQQASADARRGAEPGAAAREALAQKQENVNRTPSPATQPDNERLYRRGLGRNEDLVAQSPTPASRPAPSAAPKTVDEAAARDVASDSPGRAKSKADASTLALGDRAGVVPKDELNLGLQKPAAVAPAGGAVQPTSPEAGQNAQANSPLVRGRFVPGDTATWNMRLGGADASPGRGGVIVARMNRRQANELGLELSREQGRRAELRDFGAIAGTTVAGKPTSTAADALPTAAAGAATATTDKAAAVVAEKPAGDAFHLTPQPQDEPVDVVIVVKPDAAAPPPAAAVAKPEPDTKK